MPQAKQESTCINLQTAPCSVTAGTPSPSNADTRRAKLASVSEGARLARTSVTRRSSRKSSVFEPAVAWSSRVFNSVVSSAPHSPKMANAWLCSMRPTPLRSGTSLALNVSSSPAPSRKRALPQLTNAGCTADTTSLAGLILELALMVRRLVFTCVVNDRRPSFQCTSLATTSHSTAAAQ